MFDKGTGRVTPADVDRAADGDDAWDLVADGYREEFAEIDKDSFAQRIAFSTLVASVRKRQNVMRGTDAVLEDLKLLSDRGKVISEFYQKALAMEADFQRLNNISFWNETPRTQRQTAVLQRTKLRADAATVALYWTC